MTVRVPRELLERDPERLAPLAGLDYLPDDRPGIARRRCGRGFTYVDPGGARVRPPDRDRLAGLAVPPAWQDVWLSPTPQGHLQATGRDDADRKQYRYHEAFRALCERRKFDRLRYFPRALRLLRERVDEDLRLPLGTRDHAVAAALRLIDDGLVRVGNEVSARDGHHGATTLHADHLETEPDEGYVELQYTAKSGKVRTVTIEDEQLAHVLTRLAEGAEDLFWYTDADGQARSVEGVDINATMAETVGPAFTAKDFRTWGGSRRALEARAAGADEIEATDTAADALGNTRAVARSSYIHPDVLTADQATVESCWDRSRSSRWLSRGDSALAKLLRSS